MTTGNRVGVDLVGFDDSHIHLLITGCIGHLRLDIFDQRFEVRDILATANDLLIFAFEGNFVILQYIAAELRFFALRNFDFLQLGHLFGRQFAEHARHELVAFLGKGLEHVLELLGRVGGPLSRRPGGTNSQAHADNEGASHKLEFSRSLTDAGHQS